MPDDVVSRQAAGREAARHGGTVITGRPQSLVADLAFAATAASRRQETVTVRAKQKYWKAKACGGCERVTLRPTSLAVN